MSSGSTVLQKWLELENQTFIILILMTVFFSGNKNFNKIMLKSCGPKSTNKNLYGYKCGSKRIMEPNYEELCFCVDDLCNFSITSCKKSCEWWR